MSGNENAITKWITHAWKWVKKHFLAVFAIVMVLTLVVVGGGYIASHTTRRAGEQWVLSKGTLTDIAVFDGTVEAGLQATLSFDRNGRLAFLRGVGGMVKEGEVVARLEVDEEAVARLEAARAALEAERATLAQLRRGVRPEERAEVEAQLNHARSLIPSRVRQLASRIASSVDRSRAAIGEGIDPLFRDPSSPFRTLRFRTTQSSAADRLASEREFIPQLLTAAEVRARTALEAAASNPPQEATVRAVLPDARTLLERVREVLLLADTALQGAIAGDDVTEEAIQRWRQAVGKHLVGLSAELVALDGAAEALDAAHGSLQQVEATLMRLDAGSDPLAIGRQQARVAAQEAVVREARAVVDGYVLRAPFRGKVVTHHRQVGEEVRAGEPIVDLISGEAVSIDARVSELDLPWVPQGSVVEVRFDALPKTVVEGVVTERELLPRSTSASMVPRYHIAIALRTVPPELVPGMTARVVARREIARDVFVVPLRFIAQRQGNHAQIRVRSGGGRWQWRTARIVAENRAGEVALDGDLREGDVLIAP